MAAPAADLLASVGPRPAPDVCQTMAEVRQGVDALDAALVVLLAERQRYMDAAARIKSDRGAVRDEARIEQVIGNILAAARGCGLSAAIAEPVWRALIEASIAHELEAFDRRRGQAS
jgi:isochorismate pyruvate lyase